MKTVTVKHAAGIAAAAMLCGCTATTPRLDTHFGQAVNTAKLQQTLNPQASANTDPVTGLGGVPARESIIRYNDSFKTPPPTFEIILNGVSGQSAQ
jgi:hypothetical protein